MSSPVEQSMPAARAPVGTGTTPVYAQLVALALASLGVSAIRDWLVAVGAISGTTWTGSFLRALDGARPTDWVLAVCVVMIVVGLALLVAALRPRPTKAIELRSETGVFLRTRDLARIAHVVARDVDGVIAVKASVRRRRLTVQTTTITTKDHNSTTSSEVRERLVPAFEALQNQPKIKVAIKNEVTTR